MTNTEYWPAKKPDECPTVSDAEMYGSLDIAKPEVQRTIQDMVKRKVAMTSTLAVMELSSPSHVPLDTRVLDVLHPDAAKAVADWHARGKTRDDGVQRENLQRAMKFERAFVAAGGLLAAGSDPCCLSVTAGYGDQRNFELLVEAGFTAEEAIRIMTANGAAVLGMADRIGTVERGKQADLVVLQGDLTKTPADIRRVSIVFRRGIGYDPGKLTESVRGLVGVR